MKHWDDDGRHESYERSREELAELKRRNARESRVHMLRTFIPLAVAGGLATWFMTRSENTAEDLTVDLQDAQCMQVLRNLEGMDPEPEEWAQYCTREDIKKCLAGSFHCE